MRGCQEQKVPAISDLTGQILVFWKNGCLQELVTSRFQLRCVGFRAENDGLLYIQIPLFCVFFHCLFSMLAGIPF